MFIIVGNGKVMRMDNSANDDFLRFMPKHFRCAKEDLSVYYLQGVGPDDVDQKGLSVTYGEDGKLTIAEEGKPDIVHQGKKLAAWPYDDEGNFIRPLVFEADV